MTFLTPTLALVAAAIAVPSLIILYFLKLRRRDVEVSSTLLWKKAIEDLQANAPFQRLRRNILLLLQLLALAAALLALAQPQITSTLAPGSRHVILIDRSASMRSTDGDGKALGAKSRLDTAKAEALKLVDALREPSMLDVGSAGGASGDQAMVIAFDTSALVLSQFTGNKAELRRVIEAIEPTDAPTSIRDAVRLARTQAQRKTVTDTTTGQQVESMGAVGTIHIFSDGNLPDLLARARIDATGKSSDDMISPEDVVVFHPVGSPEAWNIGITGLRAERAFDDPTKLSIFVGLQSTAPAAKTAEITLAVEGRVAAVRDVSLPSAQRAGAVATEAPTDGADAPARPGRLIPAVSGVVFTIDRPEGGVITVQVRLPESQADANGPVLTTDDTGYLVVPPAKRLAIAMVSDGNLFLNEVLDGLVLAKPLKVVPTSSGQAFIESRQASEYDVIILDRWLPTVTTDDGVKGPNLPPGRFLVNGVSPPPPLGVTDKGEGDPTIVLDWRRDHPVLRNLSLDSVTISPAHKTSIPAGGSATPLAIGQEGPLIIEVSDPSRRAIVLTFDLVKSTWPFDPASFVVFVVRSLEHLAGNTGSLDPAGGVLRPGDTLTTRLPAGSSAAKVILPDSSEQPLVAGPSGEVNFAPVQRTGIYTLSWTGVPGPTDVEAPGGPRRAIAANLLDGAESDTAATPAIELASNATLIQGSPGRSPGIASLWPYLVMLVLVIVMIEWWVYNRKVMI